LMLAGGWLSLSNTLFAPPCRAAMGTGCGGNPALLAGRRLPPGGSARDPMVYRWRDQISSDRRDLRHGASERRFCSNGSQGTAAHTARELLRSRVRLAATPAAVSGLGGRPPKLMRWPAGRRRPQAVTHAVLRLQVLLSLQPTFSRDTVDRRAAGVSCWRKAVMTPGVIASRSISVATNRKAEEMWRTPPLYPSHPPA